MNSLRKCLVALVGIVMISTSSHAQQLPIILNDGRSIVLGTNAAAPAIPDPTWGWYINETDTNTLTPWAGSITGTNFGLVPTNMTPWAYAATRPNYVQLGNNCRPTSGITISVWLNRTFESAAFADPVWMSQSQTPPYNGMALSLTGNKIQFQATYSVSGLRNDVGAEILVPSGSWQHLVATYNGTNTVLYVNGTQDLSVARSGLLIYSNAMPTTVSWNSESYGVRGSIDDVRVWDYAITSNQVKLLTTDGRK
jgi:hypothetical protein